MTYTQLIKAFEQACAYGKGASRAGVISPAEHAFWYLTGFLGIPAFATEPVSNRPPQPSDEYDPNAHAEGQAAKRDLTSTVQCPEHPEWIGHYLVDGEPEFEKEIDARIEREKERRDEEAREDCPCDDP